MRTRLQTTSSARFRSAWHCLEQTVRTEGVLALWKGLRPQVLISLPYSTLLFGTYQVLRPERPQATPAVFTAADWRTFYMGVFGAGFGSGVALTVFQNPLDVWRTRLQTSYTDRQPPPPISVPNAWRGISLTAVRNLPGNGFFFVVHEALEVNVREPISGNDGPMSPAVARMLCGGVTGVLYNLVLSPFDVVRSRVMATSSGDAVHHARAVLREHGVQGFVRGAGVTVLKAFPTNAVGFLALSEAKWLLGVA